jgi:hypothetical protein
MVTIGPVLYLVAQPVIVALMTLFTNAILPILIALKPVYEYIFYFVCFAFIVEGARFPVTTGR